MTAQYKGGEAGGGMLVVGPPKNLPGPLPDNRYPEADLSSLCQ